MHDVIAFRKPSTSGAIEVLESRFDELHTLLALTKATIERYAPETGSDAPHWLLPICEVIDGLQMHIENAQCIGSGCGNLATRHVEFDRYCETCHDKYFIQCDHCNQPLLISEAVGDPMTHEHCQGGEV